MYLLDTNVISELRKKSADPQVIGWLRLRHPTDLYLSAITLFEIEVGVRRVVRRDPAQGQRLRAWVNELGESFRGRILPVDQQVAVLAASLHVPDPAPDRDAFIAATALANNLTVVTRNVRDFKPCGVPLIDPWNA